MQADRNGLFLPVGVLNAKAFRYIAHQSVGVSLWLHGFCHFEKPHGDRPFSFVVGREKSCVEPREGVRYDSPLLQKLGTGGFGHLHVNLKKTPGRRQQLVLRQKSVPVSEIVAQHMEDPRFGAQSRSRVNPILRHCGGVNLLKVGLILLAAEQIGIFPHRLRRGKPIPLVEQNGRIGGELHSPELFNDFFDSLQVPVAPHDLLGLAGRDALDLG
ncbi:hypothetical protein SDC9_106997 [bioreactor metagenome]|uniref:Uncharacterized protein n=1 Tax=bioreactor metagenome TaxID=1076179 RepID=A0A645B3V6_9ZZZZ